MTVLIIEDEEFSAHMITEMVKPFTSRPYVARTMREATQFIVESGERPAIITVDLTLPDSDRNATMAHNITAIRSQAPDALIIVMTGMTMPGDSEKCRKAGADGVFEKMEVATPNAFMTQLKALVLEMLNHPTTLRQKLRVVEAVSGCIAKVAGATDTTIATAKRDSES